MLFKHFCIIYLNLLMIIFFFLDMPLFIILILFIKYSYVISKLHFEQLNTISEYDDEDDSSMFLDYDVETFNYIQFWRGDYYLWFNCHFFFFFYGGNTILNELDFLDLIFYKIFDIQNFKYSYKDNFYKILYNKKNYYYLYEFNNIYIKRYNLKHNIKLLNINTYNILNNMDNLSNLENKKKLIYRNKFK